MDFKFTGIFNRCVTLELINELCFRNAEEVQVLLDGSPVLTTDQNVFTLFGLKPGRDYQVTVKDSQGQVTHAVRTKEESVFLNVRMFGAAGDGRKDDTAALQAAIMSCPEKGTVYIPAGTYFVTPLFLKSSMTLYLDQGAVLLGDPDRTHYPILPGMTRGTDEKSEYNLSSWEGNPLTAFASMITAIDVHDTDIIGQGTLDGNAPASDWWVDPKVKRIAWRPNLVFWNGCSNMRMAGLMIRNSPCWNVHPYYCDHIQFMNLNIQNPADSPNTDGFDPESCTDVLLVGTTISVGDDCIAIKSGKIYMAMEHFRRTTGVEIRNCLLERGHGSVTVGSEIAGGVTDVHVHQCLFSQTDRGLRIKTRRGRSERSVLDNIVLENVEMDRVHMALTMNMFYFCDPDGHSDYVQCQDPLPVTEETPRIGTITVRNVRCTGAEAAFVCAYGLPEMPIGEIALENIQVSFLPEEERQPRQAIMMDNFPNMNGQSFFVRNCSKLSMRNITVSGSADKEPILISVAATEIDQVSYT